MSAHFSDDIHTQQVYYGIHDFFDNYPLHTAIKLLESIIYAASRISFWKKGNPHEVIYFIGKVELLCDVAFSLSATIPTAGDLAAKRFEKKSVKTFFQEDFVGAHKTDTAWDSFPRSLSYIQYCNPYITLKKFSDFQPKEKWKQAFTDIIEYALSNCSIDDEYSMARVFTMRKKLLQLIEACHLIEVRRAFKSPSN